MKSLKLGRGLFSKRPVKAFVLNFLRLKFFFGPNEILSSFKNEIYVIKKRENKSLFNSSHRFFFIKYVEALCKIWESPTGLDYN